MLGMLIYQKLEEIAQISQPGEGVTRLSFTPEHANAIKYLQELMEQSYLTVKVDNIGHLIGEYNSSEPSAKTLVMGSHQDTVINGGKYDGILGVILPILCFKNYYETYGPPDFNFKVIAFSDEEGVQFATAFLGSKVLSKSFTDDLWDRVGSLGKTLFQAVEDFGLTPDLSQCSIQGDSFLELHIEQGPVLENHNIPLGIVQAIQGIQRYQIEITGVAGHSGTVPMHLRNDAGVGVAELISQMTHYVESLNDVVFTVGALDLLPGAVNVIPGKAIFTVDLRAMDDELLDTVADKLKSILITICEKRHLSYSFEQKMKSLSTMCCPKIIQLLEKSCDNAQIPKFHIASGAGHDTQEMAKIMDSGMLFLRCKEGISHNPAESVTVEDIDVACKVIIEFIKEYQSNISNI